MGTKARGRLVVGVLVGLVALPLSAGSPPPTFANHDGDPIHDTFQRGDVFVAISDGKVQWRQPDGTLNKTLDTGDGGFTTGMAFDDSGHLFVTGFSSHKIYEFDTAGDVVGTFATLDGTTDCQPESLVFDAAGNLYVGQAGCSDDVLKFAPDGSLADRFDVAVEDRGSDWIDLEPDQCTLRYTSEGSRVLRYDVCQDIQLDDWGSGLTTSYALRMLPDDPFDPDLLVASTQNIRRMHFGLSTTGYDAAGQDCWFALNLDPDATTFWSADFCTSEVYRFDIASGEVVSSFDTGTGTSTVFGLAVFAELGTSTVRDCSSQDLSGTFGEIAADAQAGERVSVLYDARFLVDETLDAFAAEAFAMAQQIGQRAEAALAYYADLELPAPDPVEDPVTIRIRCDPLFGRDAQVLGIDAVNIRADFVRGELAGAAGEGFPLNDQDDLDWDDDVADWKNVVDHEMFHVVQYTGSSVWGGVATAHSFIVEAPAVVAQDLFEE